MERYFNVNKGGTINERISYLTCSVKEICPNNFLELNKQPCADGK